MDGKSLHHLPLSCKLVPMKPHLDQAYFYWKNLLQSDDKVIDATCGNGKDALKLTELVPQGYVYALDIQESALQKAKELIPYSNISYILQSHTRLPSGDFKLVVYNLGYLPGGNKDLTTLTATTLESLEKAAQLIIIGGALSITCYPGHPEGALEERAIRGWVGSLDSKNWLIAHHVWREKSPTLFFIIKIKN
jgi:SAM-dependent methyltransferase